MKRKPLIMMKKTLSLIVSAALLAGCATAAKHKKGDDWTEFGKMFHQDMKESGDRIQKQLELKVSLQNTLSLTITMSKKLLLMMLT